MAVLPASGAEAFATCLRPHLARLLGAIGLDVDYERAEGDRMLWRDRDGREREALDLLGGYGTLLLGHNHPELVERATAVLRARRPFAAQASVRGAAGRLAATLADRVRRATGRDCVVTLANSGAEAVEAAIRHAELETTRRVEAITAELHRGMAALRLRQRQGGAEAVRALLASAAAELELPHLRDLDALELELRGRQAKLWQESGVLLAVEGAFHGKTTGALQLTHGAAARGEWRATRAAVRFVPRNDPAAVGREVDRAAADYPSLELDGGGARIVRRPWSRIAVCFAEPIQGEGGIHELSPDFLAALRRAADDAAFPLVFDEIQTGLGRTGTFLAAEHAGVRADYYLLGKALGGGLAKVSALLVDRGRYVDEFGYLHTSTFADDDLSSEVALGTLALIERDRLADACREKGEHLLSRLRAVQARHPEVVRAVRGRGLMIGVELDGRASPSKLLAVLAEQKLLGMVLCGHLLHAHGIRVAPALSAHGTIRIEPSAYVEVAELDRFCAALDGAVAAIERGDAGALAGALAADAAEAVSAA